MLSEAYQGSVRSFVGSLRFVADEVEDDLLIATLDAAWVQGADPDPALALALLWHPTLAVRKAAAQYVALEVGSEAELAALLAGSDPQVSAVARDVFAGRSTPAGTPLAVAFDREGCP